MADTPSILDLIDPFFAEIHGRRADPVGQLIHCVLQAAAPDAVFQDLAQQLLRGYPSVTRRKKITMLAAAFGCDRKRLKEYLRAFSLCGPAD